MTHTKFIELLNLYLDHEISPEDSALLEHEIQQDPARRDLYRQYCRMQKGCSQLAVNFNNLTSTAAFAHHPPASRQPRRYWAGWSAGIGTLAAAACVTFVVMSRPQPSVESTTPALAQAASVATVAQTVAPAPAAAPLLAMPSLNRTASELQTVFNPVLVTTLSTGDTAHPIFAHDSDRFDWMNHVRVAPTQAVDYNFEVAPSLSESNRRTFRSRRPIEGKVEMTAFQFQR